MKIAMLLSGGVDSSVALKSIIDRYPAAEITAFYLKIWLEDELSYLGHCPWEEDLSFAREVCEQLEVPLRVVSLQGAYHERVVSYAIKALKAGRTPSPDVFCNQKVKFGAFHEVVGDEFDKVASGHYAGIENTNEHYWLTQSQDEIKDQTYFLSHLSQKQLKRCLFPLADLPKQNVRKIASDFGLATAKRPDSQGICFLGKLKYDDFVRAHLGERPGAIICKDTGKTLGAHRGVWFHTIGQRKGLGLGGGPWFVHSKDLEKDIVYVSHAENKSHRCDFYVDDPNWICSEPEDGVYFFKVRHGPKKEKGQLKKVSQSRWRVDLENGDPGIAPGQISVVYQANRCLGGGEISLH